MILVSKIARGKGVDSWKGYQTLFSAYYFNFFYKSDFSIPKIPFFHYRKSENLTAYESKTGLLDLIIN